MPQVAIIGAGFAGLSLSLLLHKHGITSELYETRDEAYTTGGNIALAPNALRILDHIGLYDKVRTLGFNYQHIHYTNTSGQELGTFMNGSQRVYNYDAVRVQRTLVRNALREEVKRTGIPMHFDKKCTGVSEETNSHVKVTFADGEEVTADYVIGADGSHSKIRSYIAPNTDPAYSGLMAIMGECPKDQLENVSYKFGLPAFVFGDRGSFAIMQSDFGGDLVGWFATLEEPDHSREEWTNFGEDGAAMSEKLAGRFLAPTSKFPDLVKELCRRTPLESLSNWPFYQIPHLDTWFSAKSRVILIGDSAHAIPPTGGQGAAQAFEDAETLAYVLATTYGPDQLAKPETEQNTDRTNNLTKWLQHRQGRVAKVLNFTTKNGDMRKSSNHCYEQAAKEWIIWAAMKLSGPEGGAHWMYAYNPEVIRSIIA